MTNGSKKLIVEASQGIVDLAFALTPKYFRLQRQAFPAHISVIRNEWFEHPRWGEHDGEAIEFWYDPMTRNDNTYHWLRVWSDRLCDIREELGLRPHRGGVTLPPDQELCFHMSIGNTKHLK